MSDSCRFLPALYGDVIEDPPVSIEHCFLATQRLPALDDHIDVLRIQFEAITDTFGQFCSGQHSATQVVDGREPQTGDTRQYPPLGGGGGSSRGEFEHCLLRHFARQIRFIDGPTPAIPCNPGKSGKKTTPAKRGAKAPEKAIPAKAEGVREGTKTEKVLELLKQPGGPTLKELMKATGWKAHSVHGFV